MNIEVANESGVDVDEAALIDLTQYVLDQLRVHPLAELSLLVVDEDAMAGLHVQWMNETGPTDVLAFPMDELRPAAEGEDSSAPGLLGDVVLCPQVAARQARQAGHGSEDELQMLCAHGVLHLLGYDHEEPEDERRMFGLQSELLTSWHEQRAIREGSR